MQNAAELTSWIQISKQPGMDQGGARCLCVCNHVGELPKHIPRLFPKQGHLLQSQLQTRMTVTNIRSIILWKRKRISLWSNESIPRPGSLFQQKVIARVSPRLWLNWWSKKGSKEENVEQKWQFKKDKEKGRKERKQRKKKGQIKQQENKMKVIEFRIGFKIKFDLIQNSNVLIN